MPAPLESFWGRQPARGFVAASSQYVRYASAVVSAYPLTMACWARSDSLALDQCMVYIGSATIDTSYWGLILAGSVAGDPLRLINYGVPSAFKTADTSTAYPLAQWCHCAAVLTSATSQSVYLNAGSVGTNTLNNTPSSLERTSFGRIDRPSPVFPMSGSIAWPCIWNVALTVEELKLLSLGTHPQTIRPESIVCCPNMDNLYDPFLGASWTNSGTTLAAPPFIARGRSMIAKAPAVGGTAVPVFADHYHRMRRAG